MAKIYISSTYDDLKDHREKVYHTLRQMRYDVIAMEDYVATDQRPLDKCLADVTDCDLYIGLFAWRYGYVPPKDNPNLKSITELEYRKASEVSKTRLIFLIDEKAPWPPNWMDALTGEGDRGARIRAFRQELQQESTVSFFKSSDDLAGQVSVAVSHLERQLRGSAPLPAKTLDLDLVSYRDAMCRRYGRLKLEELDPTSYDIRPLTLIGMFVPQNARECAEFLPRAYELPKELQSRLRETQQLDSPEFDLETLNRLRASYYDQSPRPVLELVHDPGLRRLVVLGDPGSGKSSLLQYLMLQWTECADAERASRPLPLLIELREYARLRHEGQVRDFIEFLSSGSSVPWPLNRDQLDAWLRRRPSLALFDGLDEVFDTNLRDEVTTAIHRFADTYPEASVLVTSRIIGYQHQKWRDADFRHFMLQELEPEQIQDFLTRWHRDAYADRRDGDQKRDRLAKAIADSRAIRELAGNPLLLTMMAILNRTQDLPRDRAELYEQCSQLLLHQWKVEEALAHDSVLRTATLDYKDKRRLLMRVAWAMQDGPRSLAGNLIDEEKLEQTLAAGLTGLPNLRPDRAARALMAQLRGRNFMLCSLGGQSYAFVHRTFLEYFCAADLKWRFETTRELTLEQLKGEIFGRHWVDESWHEVLCLVAGMIAPQFLREILAELLDAKDPEQTCQHIFLSARCVGEVRNRGELGSVAETVLERLKSLIRFDLNYYYKPWASVEAEKIRSVRTRTVGLIATVWHDGYNTRGWLQARAQSDEDWYVRQAAVLELARGWKDDPQTLPWLQARAQSDENGAVRLAAVRELARGWKDDPQTLPILQARAQSDENWYVRDAAVLELARGWKDDPQTLPILQARAQSDESEYVRLAAVRELARGWKDDPQTLPILQARAQSDESEYARRSAVLELARGWKDDPKVLGFLTKLSGGKPR